MIRDSIPIHTIIGSTNSIQRVFFILSLFVRTRYKDISIHNTNVNSEGIKNAIKAQKRFILNSYSSKSFIDSTQSSTSKGAGSLEI